jgi:GNAT superfamily N-acetyltransferase
MSWLTECYAPHRDAAEVLDLWQQSLGEKYPISRRIFWQNTIGNPCYQRGDAFVVRSNGRIVGFAEVRISRAGRRGNQVGSGLTVLLVDPAHQRQGIGSILLKACERRAGETGATSFRIASESLYRFWPGIPLDLDPMRAFLEKHGYELRRGTFDLVRDLADFEMPRRCLEDIEQADAEIGPLAEEEAPELLAFQQEHFPGWETIMRAMLASGDASGIVRVRRAGKIVGTLSSFAPESRLRPANLVWERLLGADLGGIGAVGIASVERGRGLGLAMCAVACRLLKERGVRNCHIDWTGITDFYGRLGFAIWREYWMSGKELQSI